MSEIRYLRFAISDRIEHWVQMATFTTLGFTGMVQKFAESSFSQSIISGMGGIESVRIIHRIAATILMFGVVYHLGVVGYKMYVLKRKGSMLPTTDDVVVAWKMFLNNLGLSKEKPQQGRYTFEEKFEYWAFVWGTIVMGITGFMLWNPISTTRFLPGEYVPAAKAAHSNEALLAILAIAIWHFYNVHIKHLNKSMFTGKLTEHEMLEEHPLELAELRAGIHVRQLDEKKKANRRKRYFIVYPIIAFVMLVGIYFFTTYEETALATVPKAETKEIYIPLTPTPIPTLEPSPTPEITGLSWNEGINDLFVGKCAVCHSAAALGGLDVTTYEKLLEGGDNGAGIITFNPDNSLIVSKQAAGNHAGQFNEGELSLIIEWINAGAPE